MLKISIPKPCHEDWEKMTPGDHGRHCSSCMKTVVDFSSMNDDEVKHFLINKKNEQLCGRFSNQQLQTIQVDLPPNIFELSMPLWKQFLLACLVAFSMMLFSCEVNHPGPKELQGVVAGNTMKEFGSSYDKILEKDDRYKGKVGMFLTKEEWIEQVDTTKSYTVGALKSPGIIIPNDPVTKDSFQLPMIKGEIMLIEDTIPKKKEPPKIDSAKCEGFS